MAEIGALLGLMCKFASEDCTLVVYGTSTHTAVELESGTILDNMGSVLNLADVSIGLDF